jgi:hypothetical protein
MKKIIIISIFSLFFFAAWADGDHPYVGARSAGMAGVSLTHNDEWAVFNNQAAMALVPKPVVGIYYENRFFLKQTGYGALAFSMPALSGNVGFSLSHFGYSMYNENTVGVAFAKELFKYVAMGVKLDYIFVHQPLDYGNRNALTFEIGMLVTPMPDLKFGIHVYNPMQNTFLGYSNEYLPACLAVGSAYTFSKKLTISAEAEKVLHLQPMIFRFGLEYKAVNGLALRTGFSTYPVKAAFGLGFVKEHFAIDIAYSWHQILGSTPHISLAYVF